MKWQPTPVFLPGKSHGRRSLPDYSPLGRKAAEQLHFHFVWINLWVCTYVMAIYIYMHIQENTYYTYAVLCYDNSLRLCPALWNPMDCSPTGSSIHGIVQVGLQEWIAVPSSS